MVRMLKKRSRKIGTASRQKRRKQLRNALDEELKQVCRLRDNYTCQHCGKHVEGQDAHTSHVITKGQGYKLRWDLLNVLLLCFHCHRQFWHDSGEGIGWFKEKYPYRWEYLNNSRGILKLSNEDMEEKLAELKQKKRELAEVGIVRKTI